MREGTDAFEQLERCHRRLEERLDALAAAGARAESAGATAVDGDTLEVVRDVVAWFDRALRRHEEDEERSLFPRLLRAAEAADRKDVQEDVAALQREHLEHEPLKARLASLAHGAGGAGGGGGGAAELGRLTDELMRAYRTHLEREETKVFPAARALLGESDARAMSEEMNARRDADGGGRGGGNRSR